MKISGFGDGFAYHNRAEESREPVATIPNVPGIVCCIGSGSAAFDGTKDFVENEGKGELEARIEYFDGSSDHKTGTDSSEQGAWESRIGLVPSRLKEIVNGVAMVKGRERQQVFCLEGLVSN